MNPAVVAPSLLAANHGAFLQGVRMVEDAGQAGVGSDVVRRAGLDAPRALKADVFRMGDGAEQERDGEEGFSE